jgi:glutathione S-transferase
VLELYHNVNSVCAQKVRIALEEKGQEATEHLLTLQGDQNDPAYIKLNPNGVVPTLVHDGNVIVESSLILYYLDEAFPDPPLMPNSPAARHRVRMYNKLIDEYMHNACTIMTFATAFRPRFLKMPREQWLAEINKAPLKRRAEYKRSVIEHGLDSEFVIDALGQHQKMILWMVDDLNHGPYLAGDGFTNADCAVIPYILRLELLKLGGDVATISRGCRLVGARTGAFFKAFGWAQQMGSSPGSPGRFSQSTAPSGQIPRYFYQGARAMLLLHRARPKN